MIYTICTEKIRVRIHSLGAEVQEIEGLEGTHFLWSGDPTFWEGFAPLLFPFVGRLYEGGYIYQDRWYPMQIHGFLRFQEFELVEKSDTHLVLVTRSNEDTQKIYPFAFTYTIEFRVEKTSLVITSCVRNIDSKRLYYSHGSHHGFAVPLAKELEFSDYSIVFDEPTEVVRCVFSENLLDTGRVEPFALKEGTKIPLSHDLFDEDAIVLEGTGSKATLCSGKDHRMVSIEYPTARYFALWHTPKGNAPFVCMEALHALPAVEGERLVLEKKKDLYSLEPSESRTDMIKISCIE
jgi:galactose mutarotase-like enzyme